jgi:hypothetical protein
VWWVSAARIRGALARGAVRQDQRDGRAFHEEPWPGPFALQAVQQIDEDDLDQQDAAADPHGGREQEQASGGYLHNGEPAGKGIGRTDRGLRADAKSGQTGNRVQNHAGDVLSLVR